MEDLSLSHQEAKAIVKCINGQVCFLTDTPMGGSEGSSDQEGRSPEGQSPSRTLQPGEQLVDDMHQHSGNATPQASASQGKRSFDGPPEGGLLEAACSLQGHQGDLQSLPEEGGSRRSSNDSLHSFPMQTTPAGAHQAWDKARSPRSGGENGRGPSRFSRASRQLLPREADHQLPLNRLFEDLHKHAPLGAAGLLKDADLVQASHAPSPQCISPPASDLRSDTGQPRQSVFSPPRGSTLTGPSFPPTRSLPGDFSGSLSDDGTLIQRTSSPGQTLPRLAVPSAGSGDPMQPVSAPASNITSRDPSPSDRGLLSPPRRPMAARTASLCDASMSDQVRPRMAVLRADSVKEKQLRRMQATQSMKDMESSCLSGLDSFGIARGAGKSRSSTPVAGSRYPLV